MDKETLELLKKHFDIALETPDGIKKLRELILTLAMQGKLVPQDPNDQPAGELLKEIEAEKKKLIADGKIKEGKPLPEIKPDEVPYEVPEGWAWVRFGNIAQHNSGKTLDGGRNTGKLRDYITTSNLYWGYFQLETLKQMPFRDEELEKCTARFGDLLICEGGEAGRAAVWTFDREICFQNHIHRARFFNNINAYYAFRFFEKLNATGEIDNFRKGVAITSMSSKVLASMVFPLPPLAEQKRIVAKIEQLMTMCDKLEAERNERNQKRITIHTASMNRLLSTKEKPVFNSSWQFIRNNFDELYSVTENVNELKKAILQLAVMGKLVQQDPNDQPAGELLKEIEAEKKKLIAAGKIKEGKPLPEIKQDEVPYEVPEGWTWVRLRNICHDWGQKKPDKRFTYIDVSSIDNTRGIISENFQVLESSEAPSRARKIVKLNTIIYSTVRPYLLNIAIIDKEFEHEPIASTAFAILHPHKGINNKYLYYYLHSIPFIKYVELMMKGVAYPAINDGDFFQGLFPLPPLAEQKRIVAKVDQLMKLCDEVAQQIQAGTETKGSLLGAVMAGGMSRRV